MSERSKCGPIAKGVTAGALSLACLGIAGCSSNHAEASDPDSQTSATVKAQGSNPQCEVIGSKFLPIQAKPVGQYRLLGACVDTERPSKVEAIIVGGANGYEGGPTEFSTACLDQDNPKSSTGNDLMVRSAAELRGGYEQHSPVCTDGIVTSREAGHVLRVAITAGL